MPIADITKRGNKVETAANTLTYEQVKITDKQGSRAALVSCEIDMSQPDLKATAGTNSMCGMACMGKQTPTAIQLDQSQSIFTKVKTKGSDGTNPTYENTEGPEIYEPKFEPEEIPMDPDGYCYITIAVKGDGNSAAKYIYYRIRCKVKD
jgi:hypothetical protein